MILRFTSLTEDIASITSFVKLRPTPADPISAVGLMAWRAGKGFMNHEIPQWRLFCIPFGLALHLDSAQEILNRFMLMCVLFLERLKSLITRGHNQSLQQTTNLFICNYQKNKRERAHHNLTFESTSQIFCRASSTETFPWNKSPLWSSANGCRHSLPNVQGWNFSII